MQRTSSKVVLFCLLFFASCPCQAQDPERFSGTWRLLDFRYDGRTLASAKDACGVVVSAGKVAPGRLTGGRFVADSDTTTEFEWKFDEAGGRFDSVARKKDEVSTSRGTFALDGDNLTLVFLPANSTRDRPTRIPRTVSEEHRLFVLKYVRWRSP